MFHSTQTSNESAGRRRPPLAAILVVPVVVAIVLTMFAWPSAKLAPRDLPVGVAGPPAVTSAVEQRLGADAGAFEIHRYAGAAQAREAIEQREVYGAFVAEPGGMRLMTASAASAPVAQALSHAAREADVTATSHVAVDDVVAATSAGGALPASVLPLILAGILTAVVAGAAAARRRELAGLLVAGSTLGGLAAALIIQSWLGVVDGDWAVNAGVLSLTILAVAATAAGLQSLLGHAGIVIGALLMILVGNPFSGVGTAPELLPQPVGAIGQLMPPGAGGNLLRSTGLFDGAGSGGHVAVLVTWALAGLLAVLVAGRGRAARRAPVAAPAAA